MDREEIAAWVREQSVPVTSAKVYQLRQTARKAQVMTELVTDPRWASYAQELQEMKDTCEKLAKGRESILTGPKMLDPKEYAQAKLDTAIYQTYADAYGKALQMVEVLIVRGEEAMKELVKVPEEVDKAVG